MSGVQLLWHGQLYMLLLGFHSRTVCHTCLGFGRGGLAPFLNIQCYLEQQLHVGLCGGAEIVQLFSINNHLFCRLPFTISHLLRTWAILQKPTTQGLVAAVSKRLTRMVEDFFYPGIWVEGVVQGFVVISVHSFSYFKVVCIFCRGQDIFSSSAI